MPAGSVPFEGEWYRVGVLKEEGFDQFSHLESGSLRVYIEGHTGPGAPSPPTPFRLWGQEWVPPLSSPPHRQNPETSATPEWEQQSLVSATTLKNYFGPAWRSAWSEGRVWVACREVSYKA